MKYCYVFAWLLLATNLQAQDVLPEMNRRVIAYVDRVMGTKVGRGECWDLASGALDEANARWQRPNVFGRILYLEKDSLLPGDIIQFEQVVMERTEGTVTTRWRLEKHTAIVYEAKNNNEVVLAEQNMNQQRKVMRNTYHLKDVKQGKLLVYRPQK